MTTPAGWYPDPEQPTEPGRPGTLRWWNGAAWTDDRTAAPDRSPAGGASAAGSTSLQKQGAGSYPSSGGWAAAPATQGPYGQGGGGKATHTPAGEPLAGLGGRLVAKIIDWVVVSILGGVLASPFWLSLFRAFGDYLDEVTANPGGPAATDPFYLYRDPGFLLDAALATLIVLAVGALYEIGFLRFKSATPGKMAMGMRVRTWDRPRGDDAREPRLGWGTAVGRWAVEVLPAQLVGLWTLVDAVWCTWDGKKQTLHDKVVGTTVVSVRR